MLMVRSEAGVDRFSIYAGKDPCLVTELINSGNQFGKSRDTSLLVAFTQLLSAVTMDQTVDTSRRCRWFPKHVCSDT
jgi:hypothetical protein